MVCVLQPSSFSEGSTDSQVVAFPARRSLRSFATPFSDEREERERAESVEEVGDCPAPYLDGFCMVSSSRVLLRSEDVLQDAEADHNNVPAMNPTLSSSSLVARLNGCLRRRGLVL
jgi:hypothetical protein